MKAMGKALSALGLGVVVTILGMVGSAGADAASTPIDGKRAFEVLKGLAGTWSGIAGETNGPPASIQFLVASGGTVVEEVQFPGLAHEMRSLYYLEGGNLVMTHYCGIGNQPHMRLDTARSSANELVFDFVSGTNMDPAKDTHVHSGWIRPGGADRLEAEWTVYSGAKPAGSHHFSLSRAR
jgi:hypothetical protein